MERHLILFWPRAIRKHPDIVEDFISNSSIVSNLNISCDSYSDLLYIIKHMYAGKVISPRFKSWQVGLGVIRIFIINVSSEYAMMPNKSGVLKNVNLVMYRDKAMLRSLFCGNYVHATINKKEFTDDSFFFFHKEIDDMEIESSSSLDFSEWKKEVGIR